MRKNNSSDDQWISYALSDSLFDDFVEMFMWATVLGYQRYLQKIDFSRCFTFSNMVNELYQNKIFLFVNK